VNTNWLIQIALWSVELSLSFSSIFTVSLFLCIYFWQI